MNSRLIHVREVLNPFVPGHFAEKRVLKLVGWLSGHMFCYKELKLTTKPFTGCILCSLLIQMRNISLQSLGMCRKQTFGV